MPAFKAGAFVAAQRTGGDFALRLGTVVICEDDKRVIDELVAGITRVIC